MKSVTQHLKSLSVAGIFFVSLYTLYAWTGPSQLPPGGNVASPVNTGTLEQVKDGGLSVNAFSAFADSYFAGNVGIGTTVPGTKLDVTGGAIAIQPSASEQTGSMLIINNGYQDKVGIVLNQNHTGTGRSWYVFPRMRALLLN